MYRKILVPLDGSKLAEAVLPHAMALAKALGAQVTLFSVVRAHVGVTEPVFHVVEEVLRQEEAQAVKYLEEKAQNLRAQGLKVDVRVMEGDPGTEIIRVAGKEGFDIVILATHGLTGSDRWDMGNVSDKVVKGCRVPVFLIRTLGPRGAHIDEQEVFARTGS